MQVYKSFYAFFYRRKIYKGSSSGKIMENKETSKKPESHESLKFILYLGFWIMITIWVLSAIGILSPETSSFQALTWLGSGILTFVTSIMHLTKYKKKAFAITALVLSSYLLLTFIIGFILGIYLEV